MPIDFSQGEVPNEIRKCAAHKIPHIPYLERLVCVALVHGEDADNVGGAINVRQRNLAVVSTLYAAARAH